ncbi:MAG TPA: hypothetical protein PK938_00360 [Bacteroidaceae bacterium]|jgi:hypothetical protein|nr:hypothetical protein [Bacteroidaceae bacterium]
MKRIAIMAMAALLAVTCAENVEKMAEKHLDNAREAFNAGNFNVAKQEIDSIKILYPKAFEARRQGIKLMQQIEETEQLRTIEYETKMVDTIRLAFEKIEDNFTFEKDEEYQDIGLYTIKRQSPTNNTGRNYIRGRVDEKGRMTLVSQWSGSYYIHHNRIRLSANDSYVDSPVSDDRHEFTDLGVCYEWLSFVNGNDGGMAAFIAANRDAKTIRYTVSGRDSRNPERDYSVNLNLGKDDITAIAQLYDLSQILLSLEEHKNILAEAERHLQFIRSKIKEDPAEESAQTE